LAGPVLTSLPLKHLNVQHQRHGFNGTVLVLEKSRILYKANVGMASPESGITFSFADRMISRTERQGCISPQLIWNFITL
jgi:hypothetical protein